MKSISLDASAPSAGATTQLAGIGPATAPSLLHFGGSAGGTFGSAATATTSQPAVVTAGPTIQTERERQLQQSAQRVPQSAPERGAPHLAQQPAADVPAGVGVTTAPAPAGAAPAARQDVVIVVQPDAADVDAAKLYQSQPLPQQLQLNAPPTTTTPPAATVAPNAAAAPSTQP